MLRASIVSLLAAAVALGGCRSCGGDKERAGEGGAALSGPTMPPGMLVPTDAPSAAASSAPNLRLARHVKGGAWTELQVAPRGDRPGRMDFQHWRDDSTFVSLDAMTLLHEPFARALPGFDLFLPRLFGKEALLKLAAELDAFAARSAGEIAETARELAGIARDHAAKGADLWVLGP
jgi:hypothetical protein